jgi:hypothetical protein
MKRVPVFLQRLLRIYPHGKWTFEDMFAVRFTPPELANPDAEVRTYTSETYTVPRVRVTVPFARSPFALHPQDDEPALGDAMRTDFPDFLLTLQEQAVRRLNALRVPVYLHAAPCAEHDFWPV